MNLFHRWTVKARLIFLTSFLLSLTGISLWVGNWNASRLDQLVTQYAQVEVPAVRTMTLLDMMHDGIRASAYGIVLAVQSGNAERIEEARKELLEMTENMNKYRDTLLALPLDAEIMQLIEAARPEIDAYVKLAQKLSEVAGEHRGEELNKVVVNLQEAFEVLEKSLGKLGDQIEADAQALESVATQRHKQSSLISMVMLVVSLGFGLTFGFFITQNLSNTLLTSITSLSGQAKAVAEVSEQIASAVTKLNASTQQQASGVQEVAASIEEISAMVAKTGDNAHRLEAASNKNLSAANEGRESVGLVLNSMQSISESNAETMRQVEESNAQIADIVRVIQEIGEKTKVINDIVFQTKLLSFNASVEAARAGEHGKGFAVVAEEVGNLAAMSGTAAKEISDMLSDGIGRANQIVATTQEKVTALSGVGREKVSQGVATAEQCGKVFDAIAAQVSDSSAMTTEITGAIREQATGTQEINKAMSLFNSSTQQNAQAVGQVAEIANVIMQQSQALTAVVETLNGLVQSKTSEAPTRPVFGAPAAPSSESDSDSERHAA